MRTIWSGNNQSGAEPSGEEEDDVEDLDDAPLDNERGPKPGDDRMPARKMAMPLSSDLARGVGIGCAVAVIVGFGFIIAIAYFFTGPALDVIATAPSNALMGETFTLSIEVRNPHEVGVELDNIDVPQRILKHFSITPTSPAELGEPVDGLGSLTWFPEHQLEPASSEVIEFEVEPLKPGKLVLELDVCNDFEDCSQIVRVIHVASAPEQDVLEQPPE